MRARARERRRRHGSSSSKPPLHLFFSFFAPSLRRPEALVDPAPGLCARRGHPRRRGLRPAHRKGRPDRLRRRGSGRGPGRRGRGASLDGGGSFGGSGSLGLCLAAALAQRHHHQRQQQRRWWLLDDGGRHAGLHHRRRREEDREGRVEGVEGRRRGRSRSRRSRTNDLDLDCCSRREVHQEEKGDEEEEEEGSGEGRGRRGGEEEHREFLSKRVKGKKDSFISLFFAKKKKQNENKKITSAEKTFYLSLSSVPLSSFFFQRSSEILTK